LTIPKRLSVHGVALTIEPGDGDHWLGILDDRGVADMSGDHGLMAASISMLHAACQHRCTVIVAC